MAKRRLFLAVLASTLMLGGTVVNAAPAPAAGVKNCNMTGTLTPATPVSWTAPFVVNFTQILTGTCDDNSTETTTTTGTMSGTCTVLHTPPTTTSSGSAGASASTTTTIYPTTSVSVSARVWITATVAANGGAGFSCLGQSGSITYWAVIARSTVVVI